MRLTKFNSLYDLLVFSKQTFKLRQKCSHKTAAMTTLQGGSDMRVVILLSLNVDAKANYCHPVGSESHLLLPSGLLEI